MTAAIDKSSVELVLTDQPPPVPWASKVGGTPYLVQPQDHPLDDHGNPLAFIAQLNFAYLPNLLGYPESGLLQFFISTMPAVSACAVLYHPTVAEDWAREPGDLPPWRPPPPHTSRFRSPWPVAEFTPLVDPAAEFGLTGRIASQRPATDAVFGGIRGHRIGGYPNFNQARSIPEGHVLLFQLDSDPPEPLSRWRILWGDLGTGRFTISPDDLLRCDFGNVHYEWDNS